MREGEEAEERDGAKEEEEKATPAELDLSPSTLAPRTVRLVTRWLSSVSFVRFDLDVGQMLEHAYPPSRLSDAETANVVNLAFPDSNSSSIGDQVFCFRFRSGGSKDNFLFGYTFFRQRRDASVSRGYFQKSVVIISHLPCLSLFRRVVSALGPLSFEHGASSALDAVVHDVAAWPDPAPGALLDLPVLGNVLRVQMPVFEPTDVCMSPYSPTHGSTSAHVISDAAAPPISQLFESLHEGGPGWFSSVNLYDSFRTQLPNLWYLWELAVTGEPVLVLGGSPRACSEAVLGIASLVTPLVFRGDYRPFFTIYDSDYPFFSSLHDVSPDTLPCVLLGVTNPFFLKTFERFPHIVLLGEEAAEAPPPPDAAAAAAAEADASAAAPDPEHDGPKLLKSRLPSNGNFLSAIGSGAHIVSRGTPLLVPDRAVLGRVIAPSRPASPAAASADRASSSAINNAMLRKYFTRLSQTFLQPIERFFRVDPATLPDGVEELSAPVMRSSSGEGVWNPYLERPALPRFSEEEFLAEVRRAPPPPDIPLGQRPGLLGGKGSRRARLAALYQRFFLSPHFFPWFHRERDRAGARITAYVHQVIKRIARDGNAAFAFFLDGGSVEDAERMHAAARGMLLRELARAGEVDGELVEALRAHMALILRAVPTERRAGMGGV